MATMFFFKNRLCVRIRECKQTFVRKDSLSVISEKAKKLFVSVAEAVTVPFSIISIPTQCVF